MNASPPLISVLMAVHNGEAFLREAVESILGQTERDFEFIIIDDGSTDRSLSILNEYATRDKRIRLLTRPNRGLTFTLNEGLQSCAGELIARMDGDDIADSRRFQLQLAYMRTNPEVVLCGGDFELVDGRGRLLTRIKTPKDDATLQKLALAGHTPFPHPTAFMRRAAVQQVSGYDEHFTTTQDIDLYLRLGEIGKLGCVDESILKFRQHEKSISESKRVLQRTLAKEACERAWKRRNIAGTFEATEPWRPGSDRKSRHEFALKYGWWAWESGQRQTAMIYGTKAISAKPWEPAGYKLLCCALLKPLPANHS